MFADRKELCDHREAISSWRGASLIHRFPSRWSLQRRDSGPIGGVGVERLDVTNAHSRVLADCLRNLIHSEVLENRNHAIAEGERFTELKENPLALDRTRVQQGKKFSKRARSPAIRLAAKSLARCCPLEAVNCRSASFDHPIEAVYPPRSPLHSIRLHCSSLTLYYVP